MKLNLDLVSQHMWRGKEAGTAPCVEPAISWLFSSQFSVSAWGAYSLDGSYSELDLYMTYQTERFSVTLFDYYEPVHNNFKGKNLFNLNRQITMHLVDLVLGYQPFENIPLHVMGSTMLYGCDLNDEGAQKFSTYFEASYTHQLQEYNLGGVIGFTPGNSFYSDEFAFLNVGVNLSRSFQIAKKKSFPVQVSLIGNPKKKKVSFSFKLSVI